MVVEQGSVQPYPPFLVTSPAAGNVRLLVKPGDGVTRGQQVATVGGRGVAVLAGGTVMSVLAPAAATLPVNAPLMTVKYSGFGVPVSVSPENVYRVYRAPVAGLASLTAGPSGVPCQVVPTPVVGSDQGSPGAEGSGAGPQGSSEELAVTCLLAADSKAFTGQPAKVGIRFATVRDALTLPVTAVTGEALNGTVTYVAPDGSTSARTVTLGVSDGVVVQIVGGLAAGDRVAARAPDFTG